MQNKYSLEKIASDIEENIKNFSLSEKQFEEGSQEYAFDSKLRFYNYYFNEKELLPEQIKWINQYGAFIIKLLKSGRPKGVYKSLAIKKYYENKRNEFGQWIYHRHHIDEIIFSGAILKQNKLAYDQGLSIIVSIEEHLFLHYLIVCANTTYPNHGMLLSIDLNMALWEDVVQKYCEMYNIEYKTNWKDNLTFQV